MEMKDSFGLKDKLFFYDIFDVQVFQDLSLYEAMYTPRRPKCYI